MGTVKQHFEPEAFVYRTGTAFPPYVNTAGTNFPVTGLAFDATTQQYAFVKCRALNYGGSAA
jgi:hypothetical protein